jgi:hypothetical protein
MVVFNLKMAVLPWFFKVFYIQNAVFTLENTEIVVTFTGKLVM